MLNGSVVDLINNVVNFIFSQPEDIVMPTDRHVVRDVACKSCEAEQQDMLFKGKSKYYAI